MAKFVVTCRSPWPGRPERRVPVPAGQDLFTALRAAGVPIASSCTGRRVCGRCVVAVLEGEVAPPEDDEREVLQRVEAGPGERLACRLHPKGPGLVVQAGYW